MIMGIIMREFIFCKIELLLNYVLVNVFMHSVYIYMSTTTFWLLRSAFYYYNILFSTESLFVYYTAEILLSLEFVIIYYFCISIGTYARDEEDNCLLCTCPETNFHVTLPKNNRWILIYNIQLWRKAYMLN